MNDDKLEKEIFDLMVKELNLSEVIPLIPEDKLSYDTPIFKTLEPDGLALDSLSVLELVVLLEKEYDFEIDDDEIGGLTSIKKIADLIREKTGDGNE